MTDLSLSPVSGLHDVHAVVHSADSSIGLEVEDVSTVSQNSPLLYTMVDNGRQYRYRSWKLEVTTCCRSRDREVNALAC